MSEIVPGIFKAYDVRGLYPSEIHEMVAHEIGGAYVTYLNAKRIGVSRDMRVSSPAPAARAATSSTTACRRPT